MLNIEQMVKLVEAGYTKEEISGFTSQNTPSPKQEPEQKPADNSMSKEYLAGFLMGMQNGNLKNGNITGPQRESAEDILAGLINPKKEG